MALVSKAKAARLAGVSRTTVHRYINEGKLSESDGKIDTSELMRVFGAISEQSSTPSTERSGGQPVTPQSTPQTDPLLHQLLAEKDKRIEEISQERDHWRDLAQETKLLTDQTRKEHDNRIQELTDQLVNQNKGPQPAQILIAMGMLAILVSVIFLAFTAN